MNKVKDQSSRRWLLVYLIGFSFINILVIFLFAQFTNLHISPHLKQTERIDYKSALSVDLQKTLGINHYLFQYKAWLEDLPGSSQRISEQLQLDYYEANRLMDLYENISEVSQIERDALHKLRVNLRELHQKIPQIHLWVKQGYSGSEIRNRVYFHPELFVESLDALSKSILAERENYHARINNDLKMLTTQSAMIALFFILILGVLSYVLVFRRTLIIPVERFQRYQDVLEKNFGFFKIDKDGRYTFVNPVYCRYMGASSEQDLLGKKHSTLSMESHREIWSILTQSDSWSGLLSEEVVRDGKTEVLTMQTVLFAVDGLNGQQEFVALQFDVTDLSRAKQLVQEVTQAQTYFLVNIGHQLRSPLSAVIGGLKMLSPKTIEPRDVRVLELLNKSADELLQNVNELIHFADIELGRAKLDLNAQSFAKKLSGFLVNYKAIAQQHGIHYSYEIDMKIPKCLEYDLRNINTVLDNLLHNAFKFTSKGGEVRVKIRLVSHISDRYLIEFEVMDTGIGISAEQIKRIFSGFQQLESIETRQYGGTGIGLTISQKLVELMGGDKIRVESHPEHGSNFFFQLQLKTCVPN